MISSIYQSQVAVLNELNNLFIEMSAKNCNQRCKNCYIDFPMYKKQEDFIDIDLIKQALNDTMKDNIKCIYLCGAEPMTHPDFNAILRLCLKRCDVCICTNGSFINEKKARFLKKVEGESSNEIVFKISIDHYDEIKNDDVRYRGAFRHGIFAIKHLLKYNFNVIIALTNCYNLPQNEIYEGFSRVFERYSMDFGSVRLQITPWHNKNAKSDELKISLNNNFDCVYGRVLSSKGVYTCPFLSNDYRGRCGSSFADYSKKASLETEFCATCSESDNSIFALDYSSF